jgi:hypothetical protein
MTSLCRRLRVACHRPALALIALLGGLRHGLHTAFHLDPYAAFRRGWQGMAGAPSPTPMPVSPRPIYPHAPFHVLGTYAAWALLLGLPRSAAQAMLPAALEPGPQSYTPPGQHPILLMFGHHEGVRPDFLSIRGMDYLEFLVAVPNVQWVNTARPYRGPLAFLPRLYLDQWLPVVLGWVYGFAKERGRLRAGADRYAVNSYLGNRPLIAGTFVPRGQPGPPPALPNFGALAGLFRMPFANKLTVEPFLCCFQDFKLAEATVQAVAADVTIATAFLPQLPTGRFQVPGLDEAPLGAFRIRVPWALTPPFGCASLRPGPAAGQGAGAGS